MTSVYLVKFQNFTALLVFYRGAPNWVHWAYALSQVTLLKQKIKIRNRKQYAKHDEKTQFICSKNTAHVV